MYRTKTQNVHRRLPACIRLVILCSTLLLWSCGGGGGSDDGSASPVTDTTTGQTTDGSSDVWERVELRQFQASGMLIPSIQAKYDGDTTIHLAYFTDSENQESDFTVNHQTFSLQDMTLGTAVQVIDIDNSRTLGLVLGDGNAPVLAYQGGDIRECGSEQQSDVMINIGSGSSWGEATAGIGFVERNPVFQDGLAGRRVSAATDSAGDVHVAYQFFYEGCDAMNFNYPDLLYVRKQGSNPAADADEETVEGNVYNSNGTASAQNNVGANATIVIDSDDDPAVFYYADLNPNSSSMDQKGLRIARRKADVWTPEWIEAGIQVSDISAGMDPSGNLAVAYYVESEYEDALGTHEKLLKYAVQNGSAWTVSIVDESVQCGRFCSLSFTDQGYPAIAYYASQNHSGSTTLQDLKFAEYNGSMWTAETVSAEGDIGHYNTLVFDSNGTAYIGTYSESLHTMFLFYR